LAVPEDLSKATIVLVGPGRAGRAFARSWTAVGGRLVLVARDPARASLPGRNLPGIDVRDLETGGTLDADVLILAAPDDALAALASGISSRGRWRFAFHFSGAISSSLLAPLAAASGTSVGSLHPLRAFTGLPQDDWRDAFVAVEGEPPAEDAAEEICRRIGARPHRIPTAGKPLYHLAATLAAGGSASLVSLAARAWSDAGLDEEEGRVALAQLASTAVEAVGRLPFDSALTGPVARRDVATVRLHRAALAGRPELASLYALLAGETLRRTPGRGREQEIAGILGISGEEGPPGLEGTGKKSDTVPPKG
jgi:predicted short-subunit dehydrogenase-like oxidoreductase (DUF2520 family)